MSLGSYIKMLRTRSGYTQEQLGKLIGVQRAAVQKWECGSVCNLRHETINRLSEIFNVSPSTFFEVENEAVQSVSIPVLGYVRAGQPIEAVEEIISYEEIGSHMYRQGEYFALAVKGDSMEPKISEGDVVIVRRQQSVENGEYAVVLVGNNDATVKKFYKLDNGVKLLSTNPLYDPFFFTAEEVNSLPVEVIGKVVELRAKF